MHARAAALVALLGWAPLGRGADAPPAPDLALKHLEGALMAGDGDRLAQLAPPGGRVLVDLSTPRRLRGTFGPGQLAAVWTRLAEQVATLAVVFDPAGRRRDGTTLFSRARWRWRDQGREATVTLVVTLEWRASAWRLVELRSAP